MGRPTRLTPQVQERILDALRAGGTMSMAAARGGIGEATLREWIARGEGRHTQRGQMAVYAEFAAAVTRAREEGDLALVALIRTAARTDWRAAAFLLEVRRPEEFSRRARVEMRTGPIDAGVDERIEQLAAEIEERAIERARVVLASEQDEGAE